MKSMYTRGRGPKGLCDDGVFRIIYECCESLVSESCDKSNEDVRRERFGDDVVLYSLNMFSHILLFIFQFQFIIL